MKYEKRWWLIKMNDMLKESEKSTNMLWKLFRLAVEDEAVPENTSQAVLCAIRKLRKEDC